MVVRPRAGVQRTGARRRQRDRPDQAARPAAVLRRRGAQPALSLPRRGAQPLGAAAAGRGGPVRRTRRARSSPEPPLHVPVRRAGGDRRPHDRAGRRQPRRALARRDRGRRPGAALARLLGHAQRLPAVDRPARPRQNSRRDSCTRSRSAVISWFRQHPQVRTVFVSNSPASTSAPGAASASREYAIQGYLKAWRRLPKTGARSSSCATRPSAVTTRACACSGRCRREGRASPPAPFRGRSPCKAIPPPSRPAAAAMTGACTSST